MDPHYRSISVLRTTAAQLRRATFERRVPQCRLVAAAVEMYLAATSPVPAGSPMPAKRLARREVPCAA